MDRGDVFAERVGGRLLAIALGLERGGDDVALLLSQCAWILLAAASAATTTLLVLPVVATERPHRHEVDVGRRLLSFTRAGAVGDAGVIRHHVTGLQSKFFEEERVAGDEVP